MESMIASTKTPQGPYASRASAILCKVARMLNQVSERFPQLVEPGVS
jgi:hypothetical protein